MKLEIAKILGGGLHYYYALLNGRVIDGSNEDHRPGMARLSMLEVSWRMFGEPEADAEWARFRKVTDAKVVDV